MINLFISFSLLLLIAGAQAFAGNNSSDDDRTSYRSTHFDFRLDFGLNNYLENGEFPDVNNRNYSVKPWGSWYIAAGPDNFTRIAKPLYLNWGADVAWYNFKFENPGVTIIKEAGGITYLPIDGTDINPVKNKLTAVYLDVYMVPTLYLGRDSYIRNGHFMNEKNNGFRLGIGGYAGYKIDSYSKYIVKDPEGDKRRDRNHSGFFLNNLRYGLRLQIGVNDLDFFANYDLNTLFAGGPN